MKRLAREVSGHLHDRDRARRKRKLSGSGTVKPRKHGAKRADDGWERELEDGAADGSEE
jgi:hypothetical protein